MLIKINTTLKSRFDRKTKGRVLIKYKHSDLKCLCNETASDKRTGFTYGM